MDNLFLLLFALVLLFITPNICDIIHSLTDKD
jgi:hypothetical protein